MPTMYRGYTSGNPAPPGQASARNAPTSRGNRTVRCARNRSARARHLRHRRLLEGIQVSWPQGPEQRRNTIRTRSCRSSA